MTVLALLPPAQYQAWQLLFELERTVDVPWALIGGQLVALLAADHGAALPRITQDADVLVDVRAAPGGIETVCVFLVERGLELEGVSPEGVGHRFSRAADPGPGQVSVDVLAPHGLSERTRTVTVPPARTVAVPSGSSLLAKQSRSPSPALTAARPAVGYAGAGLGCRRRRLRRRPRP